MKITDQLKSALRNALAGILKVACPHWWTYYHITRKINIQDDPRFREHTFPVRDCSWCGKSQAHMKPAVNGRYWDWEPYEHSDRIMNIKRIGGYVYKNRNK